MILDTPIFTLAEVQNVRKVSVNIDDFDVYAREAQGNYLQKLLGDKLYTALQDDLILGVPQTQKYIDLVDGVKYTDGRDIIFRGVKLYSIYVWLHLYMADSAISITPLGARMFKDENAEHNEAKESYRNLKAYFIKSADGLEDPILRFLDSKIIDYPEFAESLRIEQADLDSFNIKVIGTRFDSPSKYF